MRQVPQAHLGNPTKLHGFTRHRPTEARTNGSRPGNAIVTLQTGLAQLSALIVSYSFSVVGAIILLIAGYIASRILERSLYAGLGQIRGFDITLRRFFSKLARYAVMALVIVMVLGQFGVQTASIIAAIGAIGLAVGLALQGTLQNIAAGIMLLVLRPFRIGEDVQIGAVAGVIEEIGLFATSLRRSDGVYILAPNSTLWNQPVQNFTRNGVRRNDVAITLPEAADIGQSQKALLDLALASAKVKKQPAPTSFVSEVVDGKVILILRYWTSTADFFSTKTELTKQGTISVAADARRAAA